MIKRNLANWERWLRIAAGVATAAAGPLFFHASWIELLLVASGVSFALTGAAARCPVCHIAGVGSYKPTP